MITPLIVMVQIHGEREALCVGAKQTQMANGKIIRRKAIRPSPELIFYSEGRLPPRYPMPAIRYTVTTRHDRTTGRCKGLSMWDVYNGTHFEKTWWRKRK